MFSILDNPDTTPAQVERAVAQGLISPVAAAEWRVTYRRRRRRLWRTILRAFRPRKV